MKFDCGTVRRGLVAVALVLGSGAAQAVGPSLPSGIPNLFGIGIGSTTEFSGGKDRVVLGAPGLRYKTKSGRLLEWYGPYAQFNVLGDTGWQLGPALNYKFGRSGVDDPVVARIHEIDGALEGGLYGGYEYEKTEGIPMKLRASVTVLSGFGQTYDGARVLINGSYWQPLSRKFLIGLGVGASWAPQSFN